MKAQYMNYEKKIGGSMMTDVFRSDLMAWGGLNSGGPKWKRSRSGNINQVDR